jgi:hypothetical protein
LSVLQDDLPDPRVDLPRVLTPLGFFDGVSGCNTEVEVEAVLVSVVLERLVGEGVEGAETIDASEAGAGKLLKKWL